MGVPSPIVLGSGNPGVEPDLLVEPTFLRTNGGSQLGGIVVRMIVAKCILGMAEQILAVNEGDSALFGGFVRHGLKK